MKVPISWLKDFVEITMPIHELAGRLTMSGLEVEEITYIGLPLPETLVGGNPETKINGLPWAEDKLVTAEVLEVMPHPNADRLILCRLNDGTGEQIVLTGAPNLYPYKGQGTLLKALKVAYAREGSRIYDGHQPGQVLTTLKRAKIRGVDSYSMICSEKELGISDDHEGVIILDDDAPVGVPLAQYMGDAVLNIAITPNIARTANIIGVAREVAALIGSHFALPEDFYSFKADGPPIQGKVSIQITNPELNPRFVVGLIQGITLGPSPYWMQRRLKLAGMRPINNIVDVTNYVMLEVGEPLHAFDYDILHERVSGNMPTIITRTAYDGERLTTLDNVDRALDPYTVLVCDTAGSLSIAGVMGGQESEIYDVSNLTPPSEVNHPTVVTTSVVNPGIEEHEPTKLSSPIKPQRKTTVNILLEGAAWNYINIRRTVASQKLQSEAAYRFSRGVHPAMAERGVRRGIELMRQLAGGVICQGLVDEYPLPVIDPTVEITPRDVERWLGIQLDTREIVNILENLDFRCQVQGVGAEAKILVHTPDHRLDIGEGLTGKADLMEEIARIYGYDRIPERRMADELPPQRNNIPLEIEERVRDLLVEMGYQEIVSYRLTSPQRETRRLRPGTPLEDKPYLLINNPIASDRYALRHSLLSSVLESAERNARYTERLALFEIGPIFLNSEEGGLPDEILKLALLLAGPRALPGWQEADRAAMDFFDLKGYLSQMLDDLQIEDVRYEAMEHPSFHPGKSARIWSSDYSLGVFGELHPLVREQYDLPEQAVLAAELDLATIITITPERYEVKSVSPFPPVLEDLAIVVDEATPAQRVAEVIQTAGGRTVTSIRLFDIYRSSQIGEGKKSLAYSVAYQAADRTLTDQEAAQVRNKIVRRLEQELGAKLRS
jgi:phenylalanyl-tRNA synthetase beta chain